jgi:hypothetical protein
MTGQSKGATMTALTDRTPADIDQELADLYRQAQTAENSLKAANVQLHYALNERQQRQGYGRRPTWPTTDAEALELLRAKVADPEYQDVPWGTSPHKALERYEAAVLQLRAIEAQAEPLNDEFQRRGGWSRFFTVQQHNGHIHSSMNCTTCNRGTSATQFGWNPELSGLSEAEAVAKLGPSLCTVCFPSAPVEWTVGRQQTAEEAAADGKCLNRNGVNMKRHGMSLYGDCEACGARGVAATVGGLRKHPHARMQVEAERKARLADPKLMCTPAGDELRVDGETIRTVRAAEIKYVDEHWWMQLGKSRDDQEMASRHQAVADELLQALAVKAGVTTEEMAAKLAPRVARKLRDL